MRPWFGANCRCDHPVLVNRPKPWLGVFSGDPVLSNLSHMSNLWKQRVGFVALFGVYYVFTLHSNLADPRPSEAYPPPLEAPLSRHSSDAASARAAAAVAKHASPVAGARASAIAAPTSSPLSASGQNASSRPLGAVGAVGSSAWSGTYRCYDYGETFAAAF